MQRIRDRVGQGPAYLTFDIDALDPAFAPGTGTPVSGGFSADQALRVLWALRDLDIRGMDVVEVSPPYDVADTTSLLAARVVCDVLGTLVSEGKLGTRPETATHVEADATEAEPA